MRVDPSQPGATALSSLLARAEKASARQGGAFAALLSQGTQAAQGTRAPAAGAATARPAGSVQLFAEPTRVTATPTPAAATPAPAAPTPAAATPAPAAAPPSRGASTEAADRTTVPKNEKTRPVEGHKYEEIVAGPRNGMFLNRSGNERDGMAFLRVSRNERTFHVYGSGEDRVIVEVRHKPKGTPAPAAPAPAAATPAAPGTAAPAAPGAPANPVHQGAGVAGLPRG